MAAARRPHWPGGIGFPASCPGSAPTEPGRPSEEPRAPPSRGVTPSADAAGAGRGHRAGTWGVDIAHLPPKGRQLRPELREAVGVCGLTRQVVLLVRIGREVIEFPLLRLFPEVNQLPVPRADAPMLPHAMPCRVLIVLV